MFKSVLKEVQHWLEMISIIVHQKNSTWNNFPILSYKYYQLHIYIY